MLTVVMVAAGISVLAAGVWAQSPSVAARDALVSMLVWGADLPVDLKAFPPEVRAELEKHLQRYRTFRSRRPKPTDPGAIQMVYTAEVRYEGKLAAVSSDPKAPALAAEFVDNLRPCYEWEGYHECPELEAKFAAEYQQTHPGGPFGDYLPLLEADRWLSAANAYDYEKDPEGAARCLRAFERAIAIARRSKSPLFRMAAERLAERGHAVARD